MSKNLHVRFVVLIIAMMILLIGGISISSARENNIKELHFEGFSQNILNEISKLSNSEVQYLTKSEFADIDKSKYKILKFEVKYENRLGILTQLKSKFKNTEYQLFYTRLSINKSPELVCVLKSADKYDILRAFVTNGTNYDIDTKQIINKLTEWDKQYGIDIIGADGDWVEVKFAKMPQDTRKIAEEVYKFCPDAVEQNAGSIEALEYDIKTHKGVFLWWD